MYLKEILKNKIKINQIIIYSSKYGKVFSYINSRKINKYLIFCKTNDVNSQLINEKFKIIKKNYNIISTYPGEIIKNPHLLKKKFIHCHPGDLPKFKGSTTIYYSVILKKKACVTLFEMNKSIDGGKILYKKYFDYPKNMNSIENNFDNKVRSLTLVEYFKSKNYLKNSHTKFKVKDRYLPYYIAHPIIRQIVLNKNLLKQV
jgi:methionyl-tRNA formyltransferase